MTLAEFLASPLVDQEPAWEYLTGGRLAQKVSPDVDHAVIAFWLAHHLAVFLESSGANLECGVELREVFANASTVPDLVVHRGRFPVGPDGSFAKYPDAPPLLAIEIQSPEQTRRELLDKLDDMLRQGVMLGLLVLPRRREVVLVAPTRHTAYRGQARIPLDAIPELRDLDLTPDIIFARLPPR